MGEYILEVVDNRERGKHIKNSECQFDDKFGATTRDNKISYNIYCIIIY